MRFHKAIIAALLIRLSAASSTSEEERDTNKCQIFQQQGACYNTQNYYVTGDASNIGRAAFQASGDATATSVYEQFIEPLIEIAASASFYDVQLPSFCVGNFDGADLTSDQTVTPNLGCDNLPLKPNLQYGIVAGELEIPEILQEALEPVRLWQTTPSEETVTPVFCLTVQLPTADGACNNHLTFGASVNQGAMTALKEVMPAGGVGQAILMAIAALQATTEIDPMTFAFSFGDGLEVPVHTFLDRKFVEEDFHAHLFFSYQGAIELPFLLDNNNVAKDSIIQVDGPYQRGFHLGETTASVEEAITSILDPAKMGMTNSDILNYVRSAVSSHPEVISTRSDLVVNWRGLTRGLFPAFTISSEGEASIRAMKLPQRVGHVPAGFYMHVDAQVGTLKDISRSICDQYEGVLLTVAGVGCPDLDNESNSNDEGKLGLEIRAETMELMIEWPGFFLRCKVHGLETDNRRMNCQIEDVVFGITESQNGYVIGKSHAITGTVEEKVTEISKDAVQLADGFGRKIVVPAKLSNKYAPKLFEPVAKFFGGEAGTTRDSVTFGFLPEYTCNGEKTHRLWSSRSRGNYKHHFSQVGNDDSRASCLVSCYEWYEANSKYNCCSYEQLGNSAECRAGYKGREHSRDNRKSATITFIEDYERLQDMPDLGSRCETGRDCVTGYCHMERCKMECAPDNLCFPSDWSKCFGNHDACLNIDGASHYCDRNTDSCKCDGDGTCIRQVHKETTLGLMRPTQDVETSNSERRR